MHGFANPTRFLSIARPLTPALMVTGVIMVAIALSIGLFSAPADRLMGETVRILYIHVPAAWLGMAGWTSIAIASLVELVWRHPLAGIAARPLRCRARSSARCASPPDRSGRGRHGAPGGCGTDG